MTCDHATRNLAPLAYDLLPDDVKAIFLAHVRGCAQCEIRLARIRSLIEGKQSTDANRARRSRIWNGVVSALDQMEAQRCRDEMAAGREPDDCDFPRATEGIGPATPACRWEQPYTLRRLMTSDSPRALQRGRGLFDPPHSRRRAA